MGDRAATRPFDAVGLGLLALALTTRFAVFPYWKDLPLGGDEAYYWDVACAIASGRLPPPFLRPPMWSFVLAPAAMVSSEQVWGRILTALLGSFAVPVLYSLGSRLFGRRVGIVAGIGYAVLPCVVAYSHYLWSETLFSLLTLLVTDAFFRRLTTDPEGALRRGAVLSGVALLAKEAAVLLPVAMAATVLVCRIPVRARAWITAGALLLTPAVLYSAWATYSSGQVVLLADAPFYNANQVRHGRQPWHMTAAENKRLFVRELKATVAGGFLPALVAQTANLWTPNSFVVFRLWGEPATFGDYGAPAGKTLAYGVVGAYLGLMVSGLTGLVFSPLSPFKVYATSLLLALQGSGAVFLFCSHFRVPYLFLLVLYAAWLLAHAAATRDRLHGKVRLCVWIGLMAALAAIAAVKWRTLGNWGSSRRSTIQSVSTHPRRFPGNRTHDRSAPIVAGMAAAFTLKMGVAVLVGGAIAHLPQLLVAGVTTASFCGIAYRLWRKPDARAESRPSEHRASQAVLMSFAAIFFSEWGTWAR